MDLCHMSICLWGKHPATCGIHRILEYSCIRTESCFILSRVTGHMQSDKVSQESYGRWTEYCCIRSHLEGIELESVEFVNRKVAKA